MAIGFNTQNAAANLASTNTRGSNSAPRKNAKGFLNLYLPTQDGGKRKLGTIALRDGYDAEMEIFALLKEDPAALARIVNALEIDFKEYNPDDTGKKFAF